MPKPDPKIFAAARKRLQRNLTRIIDHCDQLRADLEWWNQNRTDAQPFDVGKEIALSALARQMLDLVNAGKPIPSDLSKRFDEQAEAYTDG